MASKQSVSQLVTSMIALGFIPTPSNNLRKSLGMNELVSQEFCEEMQCEQCGYEDVYIFNTIRRDDLSDNIRCIVCENELYFIDYE